MEEQIELKCLKLMKKERMKGSSEGFAQQQATVND